MRALAGCLSVARGRRLRALRQWPSAVAHLHRGGVIRAGARHEARRHQDAACQCGQKQQRDPEMRPACPADIHETSLDQGARSTTFGYPQSTAGLSRRREACVLMRRAP